MLISRSTIRIDHYHFLCGEKVLYSNFKCGESHSIFIIKAATAVLCRVQLWLENQYWYFNMQPTSIIH